MKIKRFTAANMQAGLKTIGETLGPEAVILSNRRLANGLEIVAGVDEEEYEHFTATRPAPKASSDIIKANPQAASNLDQETMQHLFAAMADKNQQAFSEAGVKPKAQPSAPARASAPASKPRSAEPVQARPQQPEVETNRASQQDFALLRREIDGLKDLLREQTEQLRMPAPQSNMSPQYERLEARLNALGFTQAVTKRLLGHFDREESIDVNWRQIMGRLASSLPVPLYEPLSSGGVFAFNGPTGAGKTTTVAKLAAHAVKDHGAASVAVISLDWFQVGGQEILRSVTDILGVDFYPLTEQDSLSLMLKKVANKRLVLIDTSGSAEALEHWNKLISEGQVDRNVQSVLVMPATMHPAAINQFVQLNKNISSSAVILSKLDESPCFGSIMEPILKHRWPIWFCTTGQSIPQDIEVANAKKLIQRLIKGLQVEQAQTLAAG